MNGGGSCPAGRHEPQYARSECGGCGHQESWCGQCGAFLCACGPAESRPVRVQRSRAAGWRMPQNTIYVGRPTRWGNPWRIEDFIDGLDQYAQDAPVDGGFTRAAKRAMAAGIAVAHLEAHLRAGTLADSYPSVEQIRTELAGANLACWCPAGQPCHADLLLTIAADPSWPEPVRLPQHT